jgi:tetratricopeptide (TPR) repeat protein
VGYQTLTDFDGSSGRTSSEDSIGMDDMQNRKEEDSYERRQKIYKKANEAYKAYHARRWARARQLFTELLDLDQRHPSYRHAMADIEHNLGNFEDSIKHRKKEIQYSIEASKRSYTDLLKSYMALLNTFVSKMGSSLPLTLISKMGSKWGQVCL